MNVPNSHIGPSGTKFNIPVVIKLRYNESKLGQYGDESSLSIFSYDYQGQSWYELTNPSIDAVNNTVSGETMHLSPYFVGEQWRLRWYSNEIVGTDSHESEYMPILFIHGFKMPFGGFGKLEDTFGEAPMLLLNIFSGRPEIKRLDIWAFEYSTGDWIEYSAGRLSAAINMIKRETNCDRIIIIAHSLGGLVARAYLENMAIWEPTRRQANYIGDVGKIMMTGTPNHGALLSYAGEITLTPSVGQMNPLSAFISDINDTYWHKMPNSLGVHVVYGMIPIFLGDGIVLASSAVLSPEYSISDFKEFETVRLDAYQHISNFPNPLAEYALAYVKPGQAINHEGYQLMRDFVLACSSLNEVTIELDEPGFDFDCDGIPDIQFVSSDFVGNPGYFFATENGSYCGGAGLGSGNRIATLSRYGISDFCSLEKAINFVSGSDNIGTYFTYTGPNPGGVYAVRSYNGDSYYKVQVTEYSQARIKFKWAPIENPSCQTCVPGAAGMQICPGL